MTSSASGHVFRSEGVGDYATDEHSLATPQHKGSGEASHFTPSHSHTLTHTFTLMASHVHSTLTPSLTHSLTHSLTSSHSLVPSHIHCLTGGKRGIFWSFFCSFLSLPIWKIDRKGWKILLLVSVSTRKNCLFSGGDS